MLSDDGVFEGYCKDMMDLICEMVQKQCELHLVTDDLYGQYDRQKGRWSGMIGEILDGVSCLTTKGISRNGHSFIIFDIIK